jgi:DNA-binding protein H-NS
MTPDEEVQQKLADKIMELAGKLDEQAAVIDRQTTVIQKLEEHNEMLQVKLLNANRELVDYVESHTQFLKPQPVSEPTIGEPVNNWIN